MASRRFPLPWIVEETAESLCIRDEPTSMPWANTDGTWRWIDWPRTKPVMSPLISQSCRSC